MKTIVITGANRGLGLATLRLFATHNYNVIAIVRKPNIEFDAECHQLRDAFHIDVKTLYADFSNMDELNRVIESIEALDVTINALVNNAGVCVRKALFYVQEEDLQESFQVNYFAPVILTKAISSMMMRSGGGAIVNISSMFGDHGHQSGGTCYDASKAALNQFTMSLAQEVAPFDIRVNAVACGNMNTDMYTSMPEKEQKRFTSLNAMKRVAEPKEIANLVYWLTTDEASYMTGQIIRCDGGAKI